MFSFSILYCHKGLFLNDVIHVGGDGGLEKMAKKTEKCMLEICLKCIWLYYFAFKVWEIKLKGNANKSL